MLFVFLIFETAKLSREKIRHQFAIDAAAFVEMTNYSDFLNRSAYVNGPFPMRIFFEGFHDTPLNCLGREPDGRPCNGTRALDDVLYDDGVFPRDPGNPTRQDFAAGESPWNIEFGGSRSGMNSEDPVVSTPGGDCNTTGSQNHTNAGPSVGSAVDNCVVIVSMRTAKAWNINWDDANQIYKLYVQIYQLLGSVESAQYSVLSRLSAKHNFLTKSYWLNVGGDQAVTEATQAANKFDGQAGGFMGAVNFHCAKHVMFMGNQIVTNVLGQPYQIWASDPPPTMPDTIAECSQSGGGLFQLVTVRHDVLQAMNDGWTAEAHWTAPSNYWNIDVNGMMSGLDANGPRVRATAQVVGYGTPPFNAGVWPQPTPKFQVRTKP